ncbi:MAG TPA: MBL fold metallo-hydrolase [Chlamydiales bacterium]|nr:MBL fold metallo-hydrolase [Chlamydiales bacterium]
MKFSNTYIQNVKRSLWNFLLWMMGYYRADRHVMLPTDFQYPLPAGSFNPNQASAVWIGHSTYLLQFDGISILTDPIWSKRCSPLKFIGPKRKQAPAFSLDTLPKINIVLISHNHYDHLDRATVMKLNRDHPGILWIVPKGLKSWFEKRKIKNVYEIGWHESLELQNDGRKIEISGVPTQHFSGRTLRDLNKTGWNGYVVKITGSPTKTFYFVGDTGYNEYDFKEIGKKFPSIDLSLIPIGAYSPREFMKHVHVSPEEAVIIHEEVGSKLSLATHWKTFHLSEEPLLQPPFDLHLAMKKKGLSNFYAVEPGYYVNW